MERAFSHLPHCKAPPLQGEGTELFSSALAACRGLCCPTGASTDPAQPLCVLVPLLHGAGMLCMAHLQPQAGRARRRGTGDLPVTR